MIDEDRRRWPMRVVGAALLVLAVLGAVQTWTAAQADRRADAELARQAADNKRLTECLRAYSDGLATALEARSAAADEAQLAEDTLFETLLTTPPTAVGREAARTAFTDYVRRRAQARADRALHPLPEPPRVTC